MTDILSMQKINGILPGRKARFEVKALKDTQLTMKLPDQGESPLGLSRLEFVNFSYTNIQ